MKTIDINRTLIRCKNALMRGLPASKFLTKNTIKKMDDFVSKAEDSELVEIIKECLNCATKNPVDLSGFSKALRRYIKVSECKTTPRWFLTARASFSKERLDFLNDVYLRNVDIALEEPGTVRQIRRIVEKRMSQSYYRHHKSVKEHKDNSHRSRIKQAISFSLSNLGQVENVSITHREEGTHWRKAYDPLLKKRVLRPKQSFDNIEEARLAAAASFIRHPNEGRMEGYLCKHCGKYHIGHSRIDRTQLSLSTESMSPSTVQINQNQLSA